MIDYVSIDEIDKVIHTAKIDMVKLVVEIKSFGMSDDELDKETGSSDGLQPKQADLSCVHALNEPHLHEIHVVPSKHKADQCSLCANSKCAAVTNVLRFGTNMVAAVAGQGVTGGVYGLTPAQCLKVKEVGDLMSGEQSTESPVKGCLNLKGSEIPCRLSSYLYERLNDLVTVSERGSVKIDMSVKMRNTSTNTERPYEASGFPGIGFSCSYEE
nr:hypothetical protein [Tanacetum cinerariifolium]